VVLEPAVPVVSVDPPGLVVAPASAPVARGVVAPRRPIGSVVPGEAPGLVLLPVPLPPPLFWHAPRPINAAADAKAIHFRVMRLSW
jgi:hypothetical protein